MWGPCVPKFTINYRLHSNQSNYSACNVCPMMSPRRRRQLWRGELPPHGTRSTIYRVLETPVLVGNNALRNTTCSVAWSTPRWWWVDESIATVNCEGLTRGDMLSDSGAQGHLSTSDVIRLIFPVSQSVSRLLVMREDDTRHSLASGIMPAGAHSLSVPVLLDAANLDLLENDGSCVQCVGGQSAADIVPQR